MYLHIHCMIFPYFRLFPRCSSQISNWVQLSTHIYGLFKIHIAKSLLNCFQKYNMISSTRKAWEDWYHFPNIWYCLHFFHYKSVFPTYLFFKSIFLLWTVFSFPLPMYLLMSHVVVLTNLNEPLCSFLQPAACPLFIW